MSWIFISIISNAVLALSATFDKLLLRRSIKDPLTYAFWSTIASLVVIFLVPFGSIKAPPVTIGLSLLTGIAWFSALFFFFKAMSHGEASVALPLIGALAPVFTFAVTYFFRSEGIGFTGMAGFLFLVLGGFIFLIAEDPKLRLVVFIASGLSALGWGVSNSLLSIVFSQSSFIAGLFWTRLGAAFAACSLLLFPDMRNKLFLRSTSSPAREWFFYWGNRAIAAGGMLLNLYPFALAHPALADAANGFKYAAIVFLGWVVLGERFRGKVLVLKISAVTLVMGGLFWLGLGEYASSIPVREGREISWGITFSQKFSRALGLDWKENFSAITGDLKPERMRLVAYWDEIEREKGVYDFSELDWMLDKAHLSGIKVVLAVGLRVPRWPECHYPPWAEIQNSKFKSQNELEEYIKKVIERYKNDPAIFMWQVENEPYLMFGQCPMRSGGFLEKEIALVKSVDSSRPVLVTDGGEFGDWYRAAGSGDVFGTTMYRQVYSETIGPVLGPMHYPIAPSYFRLKERLIRRLIGDNVKKFIVIELQSEPWGEVEIPLLSAEKQVRLFPPEYFSDTLNFAEETGFDEYYLWGAEWWYWMKENRNDPRYWDIAKDLLQN